MKFNKNIYVWSILALGAMLSACSDKDEPGAGGSTDDSEGVEIGIKTAVKLNTKTALIEDLTDGHQMNVFIDVTEESGAPYKNVATKATNKGGTWALDETVRLVKGRTAEVVAIYPWVEGITDYTAYPIDVTTQADVLYSGKGAFASHTSNVVTLNMKHALSMLSINVKTMNYSGQGVISNIKIEQPTLIATKGKLNAGSGKIEATDFGPLSAKVDAAATTDGISGALPGMWVIPFVSKDADPVKATITIDGKDYNVELPEVTMFSGWQYVFQAVLSNNGLVFLPTATEEYALNMTDDEFANLEGFGLLKITFAGSTFEFPVFTGDNVFGNIKAADGSSANYSLGGSLKLSNTSAQAIEIETWGSTGFEISSMEGVEEIDLSQYK